MNKLLIILLIFSANFIYCIELDSVGSAKLDTNQIKWKDYYLLTPESTSSYVALWFHNPLPNFHSNFMIDIVANFGGLDTIGADGIALVFHRDPRDISAIGGPGLGIGYGYNPILNQRIQKSITFEFDTHYNDNLLYADDLEEDHADIRFDGVLIGTSPNKVVILINK